LDVDLMTSVRDNAVVLPGLGAATLSLPALAPARIEVRDTAATIRAGPVVLTLPEDPDRDAVGWASMRRMDLRCAGQELRVRLDDVDPYRDCYHIMVANRLPPDKVRRWEQVFNDAWALLVHHVPQQAEDLATGLRVLVPLAGTGEGPGVSATSCDAVGAFALTEPSNASELAATLVHENRHSRLAALHDIVPLCRATNTELYFAPWRNDPRPIGGLLHGVYAFAGVIGVWRELRRLPDLQLLSQARFAELREQVRHGIETLLRSDALTDAGRCFVEAVRSSVEEMLAEPVPEPVAAAARDALTGKLVAWRLRNAVI
jgi:uncharacterized protein